MKLKSFCKTKDTIDRTKQQPREWKKTFNNPTTDKRLIAKIYKETRNQQSNNLIKNRIQI